MPKAVVLSSTGTPQNGRRTQQQRRESTISKLVDATVAALIEIGFVRTSVKEICARAGVSDGGLFRHFETRLDLIVAAAESIARRTLADLEEQIAAANLGAQPLRVVISLLRASTRAPSSRVWHELLAAARTDDELRRRLEPTTRRYVHEVRGVVARLPGMDLIAADELDLWLALWLHLFDGEAIFSVVAPNSEAEDRLLNFVTDLVLTGTAAARQTTSPSRRSV